MNDIEDALALDRDRDRDWLVGRDALLGVLVVEPFVELFVVQLLVVVEVVIVQLLVVEYLLHFVVELLDW